MPGAVLVARDDEIASVTLSNPERFNALDLAMWQRLGVPVKNLGLMEAYDELRGMMAVAGRAASPRGAARRALHKRELRPLRHGGFPRRRCLLSGQEKAGLQRQIANEEAGMAAQR
jgi:hypothetical protein